MVKLPNKTLLDGSKDEARRWGYDAVQNGSRIEFLSGDQIPLRTVANGELPELTPNTVVEVRIDEQTPPDWIRRIFQKTNGKNTYLQVPFDPVHSDANSIRKTLETISVDYPLRVRSDLPPPNQGLSGGYFREGSAECIHQTGPSRPVDFSVVIPVYNNIQILAQTLENLSSVYRSDPGFEVIVVDDGSDDIASGFFETLAVDYSLQVIRNPRDRKRSMGDFSYRAGIARNIGAAFTTADTLLFLDCDILVPKDIFRKLRLQLTQFDLIMCQRKHLKVGFSGTCDHIKTEDLFFPADSDYWENFYQSQVNWNERVDRWRYVCSHSLCMSKELFLRAGGFANNYNIYGYEDVNLGFRIHELKKKFLLSDIQVFHLSPPYSRSEFSHSLTKKMGLLKCSSKIFYFNTLDDEVFRHASVFWNTPRVAFYAMEWKNRLKALRRRFLR